MIAAGVLATAALRLAPTGDPAVDLLFAYLDLPPRPSLLAVLAVQIAAVAWWRTWLVPRCSWPPRRAGCWRSPARPTSLPSSACSCWSTRSVSECRHGCPVLRRRCHRRAGGRDPTSTPGRSPTVGEWVTGTVGVVALWLIGVLVRRAERRRACRAARRSCARLGDERLGIARELHDLVVHHASAVAVQASAARSNPAALPDAVTHIEEGGRRIAETVGALADLAPPALRAAPLNRAGVEELLGPARAAGLP